MEQDTILSGGFCLFHTMVEGKHLYEVGSVLTSTPSDFARRGDMLVMINNVETQDLPPGKLVKMLSSRSPVLTMHKASIKEKEKKIIGSESMRPYHKESTKLKFSLAMTRETCLDNEEENLQEPAKPNSGDIKDVSFVDENLLLVSMSYTNVAILNGRGCEMENPCNSCFGKKCSLNDIVVATKQCEVTSDYREYIKKHFEKGEYLIQSLLQTTVCPKNILPWGKKSICMNNSTSANITIYYYQSNVLNDLGKGAAVVLNFSGSNNFLKCVHQEDKALLTVECCDKTELRVIDKDDPTTWPFVFYMSTSKDNCRRFESAAYSGWFICTKPSGSVVVENETDQNNMEVNFYIIIRCSTKS